MNIFSALESIRQAIVTGAVVDEEALAALTIWMEARGETQEGRIAVGEVIRNRMTPAKSAADVVLAPYQFSCWNTIDPNRAKALQLRRNDPLYLQCLNAWKESATSDLTHGATHYFNARTASPTWAQSGTKVATIGNHVFYVLP